MFLIFLLGWECATGIYKYRLGILLNSLTSTGWSPQQSSLSQSVHCAGVGHSGLGLGGMGLAVTSLVQRGVEAGVGGWGGHSARDASASAKPFLQMERSALHLRRGGGGGGGGIHPTVTGTAARIPRLPPIPLAPPGAQQTPASVRASARGNWDPSRRWCFPFPDRCVQCYAICVHRPQSPRGSAEPPRGKFQSQPSLCLSSILISGEHWPPPRVPCPQALFSRSWTFLALPHTPSPRPQD